jgi:hypothetical protein
MRRVGERKRLWLRPVPRSAEQRLASLPIPTRAPCSATCRPSAGTGPFILSGLSDLRQTNLDCGALPTRDA